MRSLYLNFGCVFITCKPTKIFCKCISFSCLRILLHSLLLSLWEIQVSTERKWKRQAFYCKFLPTCLSLPFVYFLLFQCFHLQSHQFTQLDWDVYISMAEIFKNDETEIFCNVFCGRAFWQRSNCCFGKHFSNHEASNSLPLISFWMRDIEISDFHWNI